MIDFANLFIATYFKISKENTKATLDSINCDDILLEITFFVHCGFSECFIILKLFSMIKLFDVSILANNQIVIVHTLSYIMKTLYGAPKIVSYTRGT